MPRLVLLIACASTLLVGQGCKPKETASTPRAQSDSNEGLRADPSALESSHFRLVLFRPQVDTFDPGRPIQKKADGKYSLSEAPSLAESQEEVDRLITELHGAFELYFINLSTRTPTLLEQFYQTMLAMRFAASAVLTENVITALQGRTQMAAVLPRPKLYNEFFSHSILSQTDGSDEQRLVRNRAEEPRLLYESMIQHIESKMAVAAASPLPYFIGLSSKIRGADRKVFLDVRLMIGLRPTVLPLNVSQDAILVKDLVVPTETDPRKQPVAYLTASLPLLDATRLEQWTESEMLAGIIEDTKIYLSFGNIGSYNALDNTFNSQRPPLDPNLSTPYARVVQTMGSTEVRINLAINDFVIDPASAQIQDIIAYITPTGVKPKDCKEFLFCMLSSLPPKLDLPLSFVEQVMPAAEGKPGIKAQVTDALNAEIMKVLPPNIQAMLKPAN